MSSLSFSIFSPWLFFFLVLFFASCFLLMVFCPFFLFFSIFPFLFFLFVVFSVVNVCSSSIHGILVDVRRWPLYPPIFWNFLVSCVPHQPSRGPCLVPALSLCLFVAKGFWLSFFLCVPFFSHVTLFFFPFFLDWVLRCGFSPRMVVSPHSVVWVSFSSICYTVGLLCSTKSAYAIAARSKHRNLPARQRTAQHAT